MALQSGTEEWHSWSRCRTFDFRGRGKGVSQIHQKCVTWQRSGYHLSRIPNPVSSARLSMLNPNLIRYGRLLASVNQAVIWFLNFQIDSWCLDSAKLFRRLYWSTRYSICSSDYFFQLYLGRSENLLSHSHLPKFVCASVSKLGFTLCHL